MKTKTKKAQTTASSLEEGFFFTGMALGGLRLPFARSASWETQQPPVNKLGPIVRKRCSTSTMRILVQVFVLPVLALLPALAYDIVKPHSSEVSSQAHPRSCPGYIPTCQSCNKCFLCLDEIDDTLIFSMRPAPRRRPLTVSRLRRSSFTWGQSILALWCSTITTMVLPHSVCSWLTKPLAV